MKMVRAQFEKSVKLINGLFHAKVRAVIVDENGMKYVSKQQGKGVGLTEAEALVKAINNLMVLAEPKN